MGVDGISAVAKAEELGLRLKQARLNRDLTQTKLAKAAGVSRKAVLNAEKGRAQLETFIAILMAMELANQLDLFLADPEVSPLQLARLNSRRRQRASGKTQLSQEDESEW